MTKRYEELQKLINASGKSNLTVADVKEFIKLAPGYKYQYKFNFYGKTVDINAKEIVLENVYIGNKGEENLRNVLEILQCCTYMNLDSFGHTLAHFHIVLTAHVFLDISGQVVTCHTDGVVRNDTTQ